MKPQKQKSKDRPSQASSPRPGQGSARSAPASEVGKDKDDSHRAAQRHQKQSQAAQLSAANVEESPEMDRGDSAAGAGESLGEAPRAGGADDSVRRGAVDTQYGTHSGTKTESTRSSPAPSRSSDSLSPDAQSSDTPNPGSSEESSGAERDTMSGPRPGGRS